jgi:hypothetical protein
VDAQPLPAPHQSDHERRLRGLLSYEKRTLGRRSASALIGRDPCHDKTGAARRVSDFAAHFAATDALAFQEIGLEDEPVTRGL